MVYGEERSVVELKKEVERLQHELRRERSTVRALQEKGKVEPIDKPAEVKKQENKDSGTTESFFYGDR